MFVVFGVHRPHCFVLRAAHNFRPKQHMGIYYTCAWIMRYVYTISFFFFWKMEKFWPDSSSNRRSSKSGLSDHWVSALQTLTFYSLIDWSIDSIHCDILCSEAKSQFAKILKPAKQKQLLTDHLTSESASQLHSDHIINHCKYVMANYSLLHCSHSPSSTFWNQ